MGYLTIKDQIEMANANEDSVNNAPPEDDSKISKSAAKEPEPAPALPSLAIEKILNYLPIKDRIAVRRVSRAFNERFNQKSSMANYIFVVDGSTPSTSCKSLQTLVDSSSHWQHIRFNQFQLESELLGDELGFLVFTRRFCPYLKSLTFQHTKMRMGRFVELLTFCDNLTNLHIVNCSSLFFTHFEILNWRPFFDKFFERLKLIEVLEIVDQNSMVPDAMLMTWVQEMKHLRSLKIHTGTKGIKLPRPAVFHAIRNNKESLTSLDLFGLSDSRKKSLWSLMEEQKCAPSKLETLRIRNVTLKPPEVVYEIWRQFGFLRDLSLDHVKIQDHCFLNLHQSLTSLESVSISFCLIEDLVLERLAKCSTIKSVAFGNNGTLSENFKISTGYYGFFQSTNSSLVHIKFNSQSDDSPPHVIPRIIMNRPYLKTLDISQVLGITRTHLLPLRFLRNTLTSLKMKGCDVNDDHFTGKPPLLSDFPALETLDLSGTDIGDRTVSDCISKWKKLKYLDLSNTNIIQWDEINGQKPSDSADTSDTSQGKHSARLLLFYFGIGGYLGVGRDAVLTLWENPYATFHSPSIISTFNLLNGSRIVC